MTSELTKARAAVAAELTRIDQHAERSRELREIAAAHKAKADAHDAKSHAMHQALAAAQVALNAAEETALREWCIELAAATVKLHNDDPLANSATVVANVVKLRAAVRSELDTPINQKWTVHPLVAQAMALQPPPDIMDTPISELHGHAANWATRRKSILATAFPPEAA